MKAPEKASGVFAGGRCTGGGARWRCGVPPRRCDAARPEAAPPTSAERVPRRPCESTTLRERVDDAREADVAEILHVARVERVDAVV
ncbi:MAG: hypothetical protein IJJ84_11235, partial [Kiritimatiellae bacterium]|nr:hypothetical protein [Kiritimatiellia bacterium]